MAGVVIEVEFGLCTEVIVAADDGVIGLLVVGVGLALADAEVLDAAAAVEVGTFLRLLVKPRLASARDKLALTDSRLKLNKPLKLLGTFKPGKPSILVVVLIFFVIGAVFWLELNLFHNLFIIAQQLWTT